MGPEIWSEPPLPKHPSENSQNWEHFSWTIRVIIGTNLLVPQVRNKICNLFNFSSLHWYKCEELAFSRITAAHNFSEGTKNSTSKSSFEKIETAFICDIPELSIRCYWRKSYYVTSKFHWRHFFHKPFPPLLWLIAVHNNSGS